MFWVFLGALAVSACTSTTDSADVPATPASAAGQQRSSVQTSSSVPPAAPSTTVPQTTSTVASTVTTTVTPTTSASLAGTTTVPPSPSTSLAGTTTLPELDVFNPSCVVRADVPGSLDLLDVGDAGVEVRIRSVGRDDFLGRGLLAGDLVDVCVDNRVNDVSGESRIGRNDPIVAAAVLDDVVQQQELLNQLFAGFAISELDVDGVSGPQTRQRLCAARLALGLPTSTTDMQPGTAEHLQLFSTETLPTPASTAVESERWILIDRTCQIMFLGEGGDTINVFATSTGTEGFETRDQDRVSAFRFNPASDNGGWHDSTDYPVGVDNPLNGNMYKPLYFDLGQAIHGANRVPTSPASKGCARLRVQDQITLLDWLGLDEATSSIWKANEIRVTVNVQGEYIPR